MCHKRCKATAPKTKTNCNSRVRLQAPANVGAGRIPHARFAGRNSGNWNNGPHLLRFQDWEKSVANPSENVAQHVDRGLDQINSCIGDLMTREGKERG